MPADRPSILFLVLPSDRRRRKLFFILAFSGTQACRDKARPFCTLQEEPVHTCLLLFSEKGRVSVVQFSHLPPILTILHEQEKEKGEKELWDF